MAAIETKLSVNLNKVALLRNQRDVGYPSVLEAARLVVAAGAHGITVHPRPDERHIRRTDVRELAALIAAEFAPAIEYNIEGYPDARLRRADRARCGPTRSRWCRTRPTSTPPITAGTSGELAPAAAADPRAQGDRRAGQPVHGRRPGAIATAATVGADRIELYTGPYAHAFAVGEAAPLLRRYVAGGRGGREAGLGVNAGHDLNLDNLPAFCQAIPQLAEVSIGHAITADALRLGFPAAVEAYLRALKRVGLPADQSTR